MSLHSYSRVWLHLTWATLERRPLLAQPAAVKLSAYLTQYSAEKKIYMKINFVNADHVHALIDLPTALSIEEVMHLLKGASSHWVNENTLCQGKFGWGHGYGVFRYHIPALRGWPGTLPTRRSIIESAALPKS